MQKSLAANILKLNKVSNENIRITRSMKKQSCGQKENQENSEIAQPKGRKEEQTCKPTEENIRITRSKNKQSCEPKEKNIRITRSKKKICGALKEISNLNRVQHRNQNMSASEVVDITGEVFNLKRTFVEEQQPLVDCALKKLKPKESEEAVQELEENTVIALDETIEEQTNKSALSVSNNKELTDPKTVIECGTSKQAVMSLRAQAVSREDPVIQKGKMPLMDGALKKLKDKESEETVQEVEENTVIALDETIEEQTNKSALSVSNNKELTNAKTVSECGTSKQAVMSLRAQAVSSEEPAIQKGKTSKQLFKVLSNMYINAAKRLELDLVPRCAEDLTFCYRHHYRTDPPENSRNTQSSILKCGLQNQLYFFFISTCFTTALRNEFPGEGIFTQLIELMLSINPNTYNNGSFSHFYNESIELFKIIVNTFPPCWLAFRHHYTDFFERSIDLKKITTKNQRQYDKLDRVLDVILQLLENMLKVEDIAEIMQKELALKTISTGFNTPPRSASQQQLEIFSASPFSEQISGCTELFNLRDWEEREENLQCFEALSVSCRIERIFVTLTLILQILENDFAMWILHHNKKTKEWIFCNINRPLIALAFDITQNMRMTYTTKQLLTIFSIAVNKGLSRSKLQILERYIGLLAMFNNTADMENTAVGVKYPYLGAKTKKFIAEFFKIFKAHNTNSISAFVDTIDILRIPFVRYEFIDYFLKLFYFSKTEDMSPKKIALDVMKQRWLKYNPKAKIQESEENLSREQYLSLLLQALKSYCHFHGTTEAFLYIFNDKPDEVFKTLADSNFHWPTHGNGNLVIDKMAEDIDSLEQQLKMTVVMSRPQVDVPLVDICIDEALVLKYRTDFKYIALMKEFVEKQCAAQTDFADWLAFLNSYASILDSN